MLFDDEESDEVLHQTGKGGADVFWGDGATGGEDELGLSLSRMLALSRSRSSNCDVPDDQPDRPVVVLHGC